MIGGNRQQQQCYRHIISIDSLVINKELGIGEFGVVQQGVWTNKDGQRIQVAIKCLSAVRLENSRLEFLKEASIMHSISNEHIVQLYGVVLEPSVMLITELAPLRSLLECLKESTLITHFPLISLCLFAQQIADGMAYLESKRLIHRDLAARNILVFNKTKIKISDFGLSRALGVGKDYYQSNFNVNLKLPIAWCAPECINYLKFTSQSDVWAYGVTLWEIFSFGFQPWAALTGQQILEAIDIPNYQRLERPECCPNEYYQLMLNCWKHEPNLRPKFSEIINLLPDCKPELLQAIKNSDNPMCKSDYLSYKSGDIVTVIDKDNDNDNMDQATSNNNGIMLWKAVTNERKTGLINPSDFVAYLGQNLPSSSSSTNHNQQNSHQSSSSSSSFVQSLLSGGNGSNGGSGNTNGNHHQNHHSNHHHSHSHSASSIASTVLQHSSKFLRGFLESTKNHHSNNNHGGGGLYSHSPHGQRKHHHNHHQQHQRLCPEMISRPQGDLKHTGHVGADGIFFGDVSFLDGKYHHVQQQQPSSKSNGILNNNDVMDSKLSKSNQRKLTISGPIQNFQSKNRKSSIDSKAIYSNSSHEYHEISDNDNNGDDNDDDDDDDLGALESPPFEILDFGPSLMEEVFRELDHIKPDLNNDAGDCETAINENSINVKNEVRELNLKMCKESNQMKKNKSNVKPISEAEQNELDSAIAMAKDIANRTMMEDDLDLTKNDSPKTPNSPNKQRKFSFKFPVTGHHHHHRSPKNERRTFSEETESIGNIIESITPAAKEAYMSLVDKGVGCSVNNVPSLPQTTTTNKESTTIDQTSNSTMFNVDHQNDQNDGDDPSNENNPLRMLRTAGIGNVLRPKIRGNRSFSQPRLPTTAQTAGLARVASSRLPLENSNNIGGEMLPIMIQQQQNPNALPLPPRDRNRPLIQLKTHQRRHPLIIPAELSDKLNNGNYQNHMITGVGDNVDGNYHHQQQQPYELSSSGHRHHHHVPVLKQVSCPQVPATFLSKTNQHHFSKSFDAVEIDDDCNKSSTTTMPQPPPKPPTRRYLSDDLTESLESEIQKAFDNIKLACSSSSSSSYLPPSTTIISSSSSSSTNTIPQQQQQSKNVNQENKSEQQQPMKLSSVSTFTNGIVGSTGQIKDSNPVQNVVVVDNVVADVKPTNQTINVISQSTMSKPSPPPPSTTLSSSSSSMEKSLKSQSSLKLSNPPTQPPPPIPRHRNIDSDEVRVMQKVLSNEINLTAEECAKILDSTDWDIHKAIKCIRLRQQLRSHNINVDCDWSKMLTKFNWNIRQASNYLIATQGVPEDTTEV
uniref:Activated Cdc42 kinase-like n=1 Tax=Dermatophagoides pteronyssinus TaxID=6956 RepID=A0A6P6YDB3_DERPT|nr:activated Cdc42 kinase-like [Dermatophagoides pteronyssinus]